MKYVIINVSENRVVSFNDYEQDVPEGFICREAKEGELDSFMTGMISYDSELDALAHPKITDHAILRRQMITKSQTVLNNWAKEKGYLDLNDLISFSNSTNKTMKADATAGIKARDDMRQAIMKYIESLGENCDVSIDDAFDSIPKPSW